VRTAEAEAELCSGRYQRWADRNVPAELHHGARPIPGRWFGLWRRNATADFTVMKRLTAAAHHGRRTDVSARPFPPLSSEPLDLGWARYASEHAIPVGAIRVPRAHDRCDHPASHHRAKGAITQLGSRIVSAQTRRTRAMSAAPCERRQPLACYRCNRAHEEECQFKQR
jgi:hypothetical protein